MNRPREVAVEGVLVDVAADLADHRSGDSAIHHRSTSDSVTAARVHRSGKFSTAFRGVLEDHGVRMVLCPARSPNCNAFAERFVRSIKSECLDRMIFIGPGSLRHALANYAAHYLAERPHQGIGNVLIEPNAAVGPASGRVVRDSRLGGLLSYYHHLAA
jgi:transposase InsO family protein